MRTKRFYLTAVVAALLLFCGTRVRAQSNVRKIEVGAQFTTIRLDDFDPLRELLKDEFPGGREESTTDAGFGGRFTYNVNNNFALEAELNWLPKEHASVVGGGRKLQGLFGPKVGVRGRKVGLFGKVRPGFMRFGGFPRVIAVSRSPTAVSALQASRVSAFFALDLGAVVELYPSPRTVVRFDAGDTIIGYGRRDPEEFNPAFTRHNPQFSAGFGFRF